jgi:glycosyltransferase involved in cell wall biosynthesis
MSNPSALECEASSSRPHRPRVSLCIPAYQAESHLRSTIDSALAQTYPDLDVVIVENNSSDGTRDILETIEDDRVRIIRNATTLAIPDNWNRAVRESHGEFVKLVCADDTLEPDCIAAQVRVLESSPDVGLVAARTDFIDDEGRLLLPGRGLGGIVGRHSGERVVRQIVRSGRNPIGPPVAGMFRRVDFDRCGGFRGDLLFPMDMDLWVRLLRNADFFGMPRTLASFRIGGDSITASTSARSQHAEHAEFARRLVEDPHWNISAIDRIFGRVNYYQTPFRRTLLYGLSGLRAWRRGRRAIDSVPAGSRLDNSVTSSR